MNGSSMYRQVTLLLALTLIMAGLLMACGGDETPATEAPAEEEAAAVTEEVVEEEAEVTEEEVATEEATEVVEAPSPTPTTPPSPTPTIPPEPTPSPTVVASNDSCVNCHFDQEQLMATAEEEEVVEELSEGEG